MQMRGVVTQTANSSMALSANINPSAPHQPFEDEELSEEEQREAEEAIFRVFNPSSPITDRFKY